MRIVSLLENTTARADMQTEHGLSLYIETQGHKLLFDMGQSDLFARNAEIMGIDLSAVDMAILSHGHYDHGGGLRTFLDINDHAPVFVSEKAFLPYYNASQKYIGLDPAYRLHPRLIFTKDTAHLAEDLTLYSCNDRECLHRFGSFGLTKQTENGRVPDDFRHEQYLLIEENGKRVLISGCSHKGIADIVAWFAPDVLIGGFHFSKMPLDETLADAARMLDAYPTAYYTCHCTGEAQFHFMKRYMKKLSYLSCGESIYF